MFKFKRVNPEISTGSDVSANPAKIVAGLEPEETNRMLQLLGKIATKKIDTTKAVAAVNGGSSSRLISEIEKKNAKSQEDLGKPNELAPPPPIERAKTPTLEKSDSRPPTSGLINPDLRAEEPPALSEKTSHAAEVQVNKSPNLKNKKPPIKNPPEEKVDVEHEAEPPVSQEPSPQLPKTRERPMSARPPPPKMKKKVIEEVEKVSAIPIHIPEKSADDDDFVVNPIEEHEVTFH
jgi:TRAF3-interacting protein 1